MRDLLRLLILAVMSFAVVGVAMVYSRGGDFGIAIRTVGDGVAGLADSLGESMGLSEPSSSHIAPDALYTVALSRPNATQWAGLAGFPDQSEVSFPLPRGYPRVAGALVLGFDTQLAEHGDGLMTLSVNGISRGQIVLDSGRAKHQIRIELTPVDLAGDRIVLHMAGRGNTNSGQICPTDAANSGSAVTLSPDSALELQFDRPLSDAVQALAVAPQPLVLQPNASEEDMALTIWANQRFNQHGIVARIGAAGTGETPVAISLNTEPAGGIPLSNSLHGENAVDQVVEALGVSPIQPQNWPVSVAELGAETTVKSFRGSRRWTIAFNAVDLPGGGLPEQFRLRLKTTLLSGTNDWVVRLSLNGNLIETRRFAGTTDTIGFDVPLPAERMLPSNSLVVELVDTTPNDGICSRGADAQAQLQPESALIDMTSAKNGWAKLVENLAGLTEVGLEADSDLSLAQAAQVGAMLSAILPRDVTPRFDGLGAVEVRMIGRQGLEQYLAGLGTDAIIKALVQSASAGNASPVLMEVSPTEPRSLLERLGPNDVAILISGL